MRMKEIYNGEKTAGRWKSLDRKKVLEQSDLVESLPHNLITENMNIAYAITLLYTRAYTV